jgi:hypothetical protein
MFVLVLAGTVTTHAAKDVDAPQPDLLYLTHGI